MDDGTHRSVMDGTDATIAAAIIANIGESVEIFYESKNVGEEWYVGLADPHGADLPVHGHFPSLIDGLKWLRDEAPGRAVV